MHEKGYTELNKKVIPSRFSTTIHKYKGKILIQGHDGRRKGISTSPTLLMKIVPSVD
jgi:hypothetical protein